MNLRVSLPSNSPRGVAEAQVVEIDGDRFIAGEPSDPVRLDHLPDCLTVFAVNDTTESITAEWVQQALADLASDEVSNDAFLKAFLFVSADHQHPCLTDSAVQVLNNRGAVWITALSETPNLSSGPHLARNGTLAPVSRLYDDTHGAFLYAIRPGPEGKFLELKVAGAHCLRTLAIAVPSRAGIAPTPNLPLNGFRIVVKDISEIANVRISVCNRAYYELYDAPTKTAACIELLIAAGAAIVGTTKLASFAATEEPVECIDYEATWNPRADGY